MRFSFFGTRSKKNNETADIPVKTSTDASSKKTTTPTTAKNNHLFPQNLPTPNAHAYSLDLKMHNEKHLRFYKEIPNKVPAISTVKPINHPVPQQIIPIITRGVVSPPPIHVRKPSRLLHSDKIGSVCANSPRKDNNEIKDNKLFVDGGEVSAMFLNHFDLEAASLVDRNPVDSTRLRTLSIEETTLVPITTRRIEEDYDFLSNTTNGPVTLGKGQFGVVVRGVHRVSGEAYAIKRIDKLRTKRSYLDAELRVQYKLRRHPNIVGLYGAYETPSSLYLVQELMTGGELFDRLITLGAYSESEASEAIRPVFAAVGYMHVCGVIHRDLKPENLLLTKATPDVFFTPNTTISQASIVNAHPHPTTSTSDNYHRRKSKQYAKSRLMNSLASSGHSENSEAMNSSANVIPSSMVVKVADFGLAKEVERDDKGHVVPLSTLCGTWAYSAPEMRAPDRPGYSFAIDAWALGVITYIILCGFHPFDPSGTGTQAEILAAIQSVNYNFNDPIWDTISPAAKDFIRKLLTKDPSTRMTTRQSLNHPWLLNSAPVGYNRPLGIPGGMTVGTQLSIYKTGMESKLKAGMLAVRAAIKFAAVAAASMKGDIAKKQNIEIEIIDPSCDQQNQLVEDYNLQEIVGTFVSSLKIDKVQDDDDPRAYSFSSVHQK